MAVLKHENLAQKDYTLYGIKIFLYLTHICVFFFLTYPNAIENHISQNSVILFASNFLIIKKNCGIRLLKKNLL